MRINTVLLHTCLNYWVLFALLYSIVWLAFTAAFSASIQRLDNWQYIPRHHPRRMEAEHPSRRETQSYSSLRTKQGCWCRRDSHRCLPNYGRGDWWDAWFHLFANIEKLETAPHKPLDLKLISLRKFYRRGWFYLRKRNRRTNFHYTENHRKG